MFQTNEQNQYILDRSGGVGLQIYAFEKNLTNSIERLQISNGKHVS